MKTISGLKKLQKALQRASGLDDVKRVVKKNGVELQQKIQRNAELIQGDQNKEIKRSISLEFTDTSMTAKCGPAVECAKYLEVGTRFMEAQPFVEPALREQAVQFKKDMEKLIK